MPSFILRSAGFARYWMNTILLGTGWPRALISRQCFVRIKRLHCRCMTLNPTWVDPVYTVCAPWTAAYTSEPLIAFMGYDLKSTWWRKPLTIGLYGTLITIWLIKGRDIKCNIKSKSIQILQRYVFNSIRVSLYMYMRDCSIFKEFIYRPNLMMLLSMCYWKRALPILMRSII